MDKHDYITKIYYIMNGLNDPRLRNVYQRFCYARDIILTRFPQDVHIINGIKPGDIVFTNINKPEIQQPELTYHNEKYVPKPINKPSVSYFTFDLDDITYRDELLTVDIDTLQQMGLIQYIRWYSVIHSKSYTDMEISKHLYSNHAPIRTLKKGEVFDEVKSSVVRYFSYLNHQESYKIQYVWDIDDSTLNATSLLSVYKDLVNEFQKLKIVFKSDDLKLDYVKDMVQDYYHHEIYSIKNEVDVKKQFKAKYLLIDYIRFEEFWEYYRPILDKQNVKDMRKMNRKSRRWRR